MRDDQPSRRSPPGPGDVALDPPLDPELTLRLVLDGTEAGVWWADLRAGVTTADTRARTHFGFTPSESLSLSAVLARVTEEDRERMTGDLEALTSRGQRCDAEFRVRHIDGRVVWIHGVCRARLDASGVPIQLVGLTLDVTERKRLDEALRAMSQHYAAIHDHAPFGIVLSRAADGHIVSVNETASRVFEWTREELVGMTSAELGLSGGRREDTLSALAVRGELRGFEVRVRTKSGLVKVVAMNVDRLTIGGEAFLLTTFADDTARVEALEALARQTGELQRRASQLQRLAAELTLTEHHAREQLARMLHDHLQQILFSSRLKLDRLGRRGQVPAQDRAVIEQLREQLDEAMAATRAFTKELFPPMLHDRGLAAALGWLAEWMQQRYNLRVELTADPRANPGQRDVRTLIFESVKELLFNVAKHAATSVATVDLRLAPTGDVQLTVSDGGRGFDPSDVFDAGRTHGTGFGLFSIRERLALMGGRLEVEARPGAGATFTLFAPSGDSQDRTAASPLRILIADDHALVRDGLRQLFLEDPQLLVVGEAIDGAQAERLADELRPDVIVMDVSMPEVDGVEATRRIHAAHPEILILGLSTHEQPEGQHAIEAAGAAGYFTKGDDGRRLLARLRALQRKERR
jgi:PAS domain S-box-containing protein